MKLNMKTLLTLFLLTLIMAVVPINADTDAELKGRITAINAKLLSDTKQDLMKNRELNNYDKDDIDRIMQQCEYLVNYSTNLFWQYYASYNSAYSSSAITPDVSGCPMQWPAAETGNVNINEETIQFPDQSITTDISVAGPIRGARRAPFWFLGVSCAMKAAQVERACLAACMMGQCTSPENVWECQLKCSQEGLIAFANCIGFKESTTTTV